MRKRLASRMITAALIVGMLSGCGSSAEETAAQTKPDAVVTEEEDVKEEATESEAEKTVESETETVEESISESTEKPSEMVSWEEWASQPGESEPHLVVWNGENGTQIIIEPYDTYTLQDGDRLAVSCSLSYEDCLQMGDVRVKAVVSGNIVKQKIIQTEYGQYWEVMIEEKGTSYVYYGFKDVGYNYFIEFE